MMFRYAYVNTIKDFINDCRNGILDKISLGFKKEYGLNPSNSETNAWRNLTDNIVEVLKILPPELDNTRIFIEFGMPFSSARADVFLLGKKNNEFAGIIIEHKQWSDNYIQIKDGLLFVGGKEELHPYLQAEGYSSYLKDYIQDLHNAIIKSVAYLPNLESVNILLQNEIETVFGKDFQDQFSNFIIDTIDKGLADEELQKFLNSHFRPSKTLVEEIENAITNQKSWILLDEQRLVFGRVKSMLENLGNNEKVVIIVKGGPGTGKSAIALQLLGYALGHGYSAVHITKSSAFTTTIKGTLLSAGNFSGNQLNGIFKLSHNFIKARKNSFDIAICDEAHRFRRSTTLRHLRSPESQIYQIINASRLSIFFVDEHQIVRPEEDGRIAHIKEQTNRLNAHIYEYELKAQFRHMGNENFVKWLDYVLELDLTDKFTDTQSWRKDFEFKIFERIEDMEEELQNKINEGSTARIVAGFVWPWNDPDVMSGTLPLDVEIGSWRKPWNRKRPSKRLLNPKEDPYYEWVTRKQNQLSEIGCVYSAQGFEFDYIGVIWGSDLVIRNEKWVANPEKSYDSPIHRKKPYQVLDLLKNTYRVLLSRGMRGCYLYFLDEETKKYFKKKHKEL